MEQRAVKRTRTVAVRVAETAGIALWRRVADQLECAIADGTYPVETRLPGEIEIALRLGVNRHPVRRALAALADRGFVRAERGSGTYVETPRLRYPIHSRTRFSEIVGAAGREPGGRLLGSAIEDAEPDIRRPPHPRPPARGNRPHLPAQLGPRPVPRRATLPTPGPPS